MDGSINRRRVDGGDGGDSSVVSPRRRVVVGAINADLLESEAGGRRGAWPRPR